MSIQIKMVFAACPSTFLSVWQSLTQAETTIKSWTIQRLLKNPTKVRHLPLPARLAKQLWMRALIFSEASPRHRDGQPIQGQTQCQSNSSACASTCFNVLYLNNLIYFNLWTLTIHDSKFQAVALWELDCAPLPSASHIASGQRLGAREPVKYKQIRSIGL